MLTTSLPVDSAAAAITDERLSEVLSLVHRDGFGHNAHVIRPDRGGAISRLRRTGIGGEAAERLAASQRPIVVIFAPARIDAAETILRRGGAARVERFAQTSGTQSALIGFDAALLHSKRSGRRGRSEQHS